MLDCTGTSPAAPVLWVAVGRQRVGKTALLSAAAQYFRARGAEVDVWNADQQNWSHALSRFFPDAIEPPSGGIEAGKRWIEARVEEQIATRRDAVLDVGGGFTGFSALVEELPLVDLLAPEGIRVVGLFVVGPEEADLDYLEAFASSNQFLPPASVVVLNAALVMGGRPADDAFAPIVAHPAIVAARARGAKIARFPALSCMSAVVDQGLCYADVLAGHRGEGPKSLGHFDRMRVRRWWGELLPAFFSSFPAAWLPGQTSTPAQRLGEEGR